MAFTSISGVTKTTAQKSARQLALEVKEDLADTAVECPPEALKSLKLNVKGENDEGAFGENTIGQKVEGELILYAGDSSVRTFAHELVTKTIKSVKATTNSGKVYTFAVPTGVTRPVLEFAYDDSSLVAEKSEPTLIKLKITGFRDNLVIS